MKIELDLRKSLHENASLLYERAKVAKRKLAGVGHALEDTKARIAKLEQGAALSASPAQPRQRKLSKKWHEKFHWFCSSDGYLVVAGRDAKSNEIIVKRHMEPNDIYMHAEVHGAPHTVIKSKGGAVPKQTLEEAAQFAASLSSAWRDRFSHIDVYSAKPEQVSKAAPSGEAISKGAFMIYGKREWFRKTPLRFAVGVKKTASGVEIISGPPSAVEKRCDAFVAVRQGRLQKGELAKAAKAALEKKLGIAINLPLDEFVAALPSGGGEA